jgi:hypothetical protein
MIQVATSGSPGAWPTSDCCACNQSLSAAIITEAHYSYVADLACRRRPLCCQLQQTRVDVVASSSSETSMHTDTGEQTVVEYQFEELKRFTGGFSTSRIIDHHNGVFGGMFYGQMFDGTGVSQEVAIQMLEKVLAYTRMYTKLFIQLN